MLLYRPVISDVFIGAVSHTPTITVAVPVWSGEKVQSILSIAIHPESINALIRQQNLPPDWIVSVFDRKGIIAARTHRFSEFVGQRGAFADITVFVERNQGAFDAVTKEGIPVVGAFNTAPDSRWRVGIGIPRAGPQATLLQEATLLGAGLFLLFALGFILALLLGDRIARSVTGLTLPAKDLIDGKSLRMSAVHFREAQDVARAMADTAHQLAMKSAEAQVAMRHLLDSKQLLRELNAGLETKVSERTQALADLYNQAPCGYHSLDAQGRIIEINQTGLDLLGYTREEVLGQSPTLFFDAQNRAKFEQVLPQLMRDGQVSNIEHDVTCKDGSRVPVLISSNLFFGAQGQVLGSRATLTDNRVNKARQWQISHLNRFLADVLESLPMGVLVLDRARNVVLKNALLARVLDYPAELMAREPLAYAELVRIDYDRGDYPGETYAKALAGRLALMNRPEAIQLERPQRSGVQLGITCQPVSNDWVLLTYADITASKALMQALADAKQVADAASQSKSAFLANMSHEMRTPINAILGVQQILSRTTMSEDQQKFLAVSTDAAKGLMSLVNDILDMSKIEAGKLDMVQAAFEPTEVTHSLLTLLQPAATAKNLRLRLEMAPEVPPMVVGDAMRLRQVLLNLGSNAIKFAETGEVLVSVRVKSRSAQEVQLLFEVRDTGIGIPADKHEHIFGAFNQASTTTVQRYGGTGLGLSISQALVKAMGGEMALQSEVGKGSTFSFDVRLPIVPPGAAVAGPSGASAVVLAPLQSSAEGSLRLQGFNILVAEDQAINRMVVERLLLQEGARVALVNNGREAVDAVRAAQQQGQMYSAVLMDLRMPVLSGLDATREIREQLALGPAQLPILALSANAKDSDVQSCLQTGMNGHIAKPLLVEDIVRELRSAVQRKQQHLSALASQKEEMPGSMPFDVELDLTGTDA